MKTYHSDKLGKVTVPDDSLPCTCDANDDSVETCERHGMSQEETMSKPQFVDYGEPWAVSPYTRDGQPIVENSNGSSVCDFWKGREFASRTVACVNACAGLSDEELTRVRAVNEMYEALKEILSRLYPEGEEVQIVMAALALAEAKEGE